MLLKQANIHNDILTRAANNLRLPEAVIDKFAGAMVHPNLQLQALASLDTATLLRHKSELIDLLPMFWAGVRQYAVGKLAELNDPECDFMLQQYLAGETSPLVNLAVEQRSTLVGYYK
jgi:hypothetical protein